MAQYIDKSALVAEIEKLKLCTMDEHMNFYSEAAEGEYHALSNLESFFDTLEAKGVDINEEAKRKWDSFSLCYDELRGCDVVVWPYWVYKQVCKYFFELGLKAQKGE